MGSRIIAECHTVSRFAAACPRLTELTIVYPNPLDAHQTSGTVILFDPAGSAHSTVLELVTVCKALPHFDTFQIVYPPSPTPSSLCRCHQGMRSRRRPSKEQLKQMEQEVKGLKDWTIECLKKSKVRRQEGEGRKRTTLRVIELSPDRPLLGSVEVEVYEV